MGLAGASIGICPLLFVGGDLPELASPIPLERLVDEIARLGFTGCQMSKKLAAGAGVMTALTAAGIRIAEVYAPLPCTVDGPTADARDRARAKVEELSRVGGETLVYSYHLSEGRVDRAGRGSDPDVPRLTDDGWKRAAALAEEIAESVRTLGRQLVYHPHVGTFVETPEEVDTLMAMTDPTFVGLCLDVGHYSVGGGDPVAALRKHGRRVRHIHMKDVDPRVLADVRQGKVRGFLDALRARIFTELGSGILDVAGIITELSRLDYAGWIMSEQDSSWRPPAESAAMSRSVLVYAIRNVAL